MRQPLNIAFFVSLDSRTGTYFRYHNLAKGLVQRGHEIKIYSQCVGHRKNGAEEKRDGVSYILAPTIPGDSYCSPAMNPGNIILRGLTHFRKRRLLAGADVIHLFQPFLNSAYQWLWGLFRRERRDGTKPLFIWDWDDLWCGGLWQPNSMTRVQDRIHYRLLEKMEHRLPRRADIVTTCSGYLASLACERGACQAEVIYNGFWPETQIIASASRSDLRRHFSLDPDALYLGFTGFTTGEFGWCLDLLARFMDHPRIRFVCCGANGEKAIRSTSEAIRSRIDNLGLLSSAETHRLLGAIDIGLLPMERNLFNESRLPMKFADYLAAGLPVFGTDIGEVGRLGRTLKGVVLLPAERTGWVEGCYKVLREHLDKKELDRPDPGQLKDQLSWPVIIDKLEQIYFRQRVAHGA